MKCFSSIFQKGKLASESSQLKTLIENLGLSGKKQSLLLGKKSFPHEPLFSTPFFRTNRYLVWTKRSSSIACQTLCSTRSAVSRRTFARLKAITFTNRAEKLHQYGNFIGRYLGTQRADAHRCRLWLRWRYCLCCGLTGIAIAGWPRDSHSLSSSQSLYDGLWSDPWSSRACCQANPETKISDYGW